MSFDGRRASREEPALAVVDKGRMELTHEHPAYEWVMAVLAVASVAVLFVSEDTAWARPLNLAIWALFVVDYVTRLAVARDRSTFVRSNLVDLVAILPADLFRLARVARLARLARAGSLVWRASANTRDVLMTNGLGWVLLAATGAILLGAAAVWAADPAFATFGDSLWWAIVTSTTVGYGDLSPTSGLARGVAVMVMFVGIGTISMLTGSIATFFSRARRDDGAAVRDDELERMAMRMAPPPATKPSTLPSAGATVVLADGRRIELDADEAEHLLVVLRGVGRL